MIGAVIAMVVVGIITPPSLEWIERAAYRRGRNQRPDKTWPGSADWLRALRSGSTAGLGTLAFGTLGILADFRPAELSALGFCIFSLILGGVPNPGKAAPVLFTGTVVGVLAAVVYRVGVLPFIGSPCWAIVSFMPFTVLGAMARAFKPVAAPALDANMVFLLLAQGSLLISTRWEAVTVEGLSIVIAAACASGAVAMIVGVHRDSAR